MKYQLRIIRSKRKTMSLEITKDVQILVRCPYQMSQRRIYTWLEEKSDWIERHLEEARERQKQMQREEKLSPAEIKKLADKALKRIPERVAYYAARMGVTYGRITIRNQKTRWGSCSQKGNLNFNCLLMLAPPEVIDYVVVHELCHRKEMNHSPKFWAEVEKVLPDYKAPKQWLKENGEMLISKCQTDII